MVDQNDDEEISFEDEKRAHQHACGCTRPPLLLPCRLTRIIFETSLREATSRNLSSSKVGSVIRSRHERISGRNDDESRTRAEEGGWTKEMILCQTSGGKR